MAISLALNGAQSETLLVFDGNSYNADLNFQLFDANGESIGAATAVSGDQPTWLGASADASGGFTIAWQTIRGQLWSESFDSTGAVVSAAHTISSWSAPPAPVAFTSQDPTGILPNGETASWGGSGSTLQLQLYAGGQPTGPTTTLYAEQFGSVKIVALANGDSAYLFSQWDGDGAGYKLQLATLDPSGNLLGVNTLEDQASAGTGSDFQSYSISGLADGGYVVGRTAAHVIDFYHSTYTDYVREYSASGTPIGDWANLGASSGAAPVINAFADGTYNVSWSDASGQPQQQVFTEQTAALGASEPAPPPTVLALQGFVGQHEGTSGTTPFDFTVTRTGDLSGSSAVDWYVWLSGGSASADSSDFSGPLGGTLFFQPGQSSGVIQVLVNGDTDSEPTEVFNLSLANPRGAAIGLGATVGVIDDGGSTSSSASTSAADYTAPEGVTSITLTGSSSQTIHANNDGDTIYSTDNGNTFFGGTGNDTFHLGRGGDAATGGGGNDTYVFDQNPWSAYGYITDFNVGDVINLLPTLEKAGFASGDPVAEGFIKVDDDASGSARIWFDPAPNAGGAWWLVTTLDDVAASTVQVNGGTITTTFSGSSGGSGGTTGVTTSDPDYTAPPGVTSITLVGTSSQTVHANNEGDAIYSNNNGNTLIGGTGDDTFVLGRNGDAVTGGGGHDTFIFPENPWSPSGVITDFNANDVIDLTPTLQKAGYSSGDAVAEGFLKFTNDASGNAQVWFNPAPGSGAFWLVTGLTGVDAASLHANAGLITA